jgi:glutamine cyclotransferase
VGEAKKKRGNKPTEPSGVASAGENPYADAPAPPRAPRREATASSPMRIGAVALVIVSFMFVSMWWRSRGQTQSHDTDGHHGTHAPPSSDAQAPTKHTSSRPEALRVNVLATHPHDPDAFTQGLQMIDGQLFEGTGLEGHSQLRRIQLPTWSVEQHVDLPADVFGEGIAVVGDRIFEITWREGIAYVWNRTTFAPITELHYEGEGWGLCYDGTHLVMSDGSDQLFFRDPATFEITRRVHVTRSGHEVDMLNELECVDGVVYANIWQTDRIARIDPATGRVTGWIDGSGLLSEEERIEADVLNGITYLPDSHRFLITGKLWPRSFEVEFVADDRAAGSH